MQGREGLRRHLASRCEIEHGDQGGKNKQAFRFHGLIILLRYVDQECILVVRLGTDPPCSRTVAAGRFGVLRREALLHPCHPCHPWLSVPVCRFNVWFHSGFRSVNWASYPVMRSSGRKWAKYFY